MKKILVLFSVIALIAMVGCKKDETDTSLNNRDLIGEIFKAGMSGYSQALTAKSQMEKATVLINFPVDNTYLSPEGGNIHITGSVTGTMSYNEDPYENLGGYLSLGFTETITDFIFLSNGQKYTMNGAPYISLTGTFTIQPGGTTFGTASSMHMGGGIRVVGPSYDQTINIQITININSTGTGGNVSGTIGGESINYTF